MLCFFTLYINLQKDLAYSTEVGKIFIVEKQKIYSKLSLLLLLGQQKVILYLYSKTYLNSKSPIMNSMITLYRKYHSLQLVINIIFPKYTISRKMLFYLHSSLQNHFNHIKIKVKPKCIDIQKHLLKLHKCILSEGTIKIQQKQFLIHN